MNIGQIFVEFKNIVIGKYRISPCTKCGSPYHIEHKWYH